MLLKLASCVFFFINKFRTDWDRTAHTNSFDLIYFKCRCKKNTSSFLHSAKPQVLTNFRNHTRISLHKAYSIYLSMNLNTRSHWELTVVSKSSLYFEESRKWPLWSNWWHLWRLYVKETLYKEWCCSVKSSIASYFAHGSENIYSGQGLGSRKNSILMEIKKKNYFFFLVSQN